MVRRVGIVLFSGFLLSTVFQGVALANCSAEENIFWAGKGVGGFLVNAAGTENQIRETGRTPDSSCSYRVNIGGSTAHLLLTLTGDDFVEVGWERATDGVFRWFAEYSISGIPHAAGSNLLTGFCPNATIGDFDYWRVEYAGGFDWSVKVKCDADLSFQTITTILDLCCAQGTPEAETFRRGAATGMSDHHHNLRYKNGGSWVAWPDMACEQDIVTDWDGNEIAANHYETKTVPYDPTPSC
jgi:hypothetical protein